jgi:hypothetical protein
MLLSVEPDRLPTRTPPHQHKQTTNHFAHDNEIQQQRKNQPSKWGENNAEKIENSPRNLTFKINSLQLLASPRRSA